MGLKIFKVLKKIFIGELINTYFIQKKKKDI